MWQPGRCPCCNQAVLVRGEGEEREYREPDFEPPNRRERLRQILIELCALRTEAENLGLERTEDLGLERSIAAVSAQITAETIRGGDEGAHEREADTTLTDRCPYCNVVISGGNPEALRLARRAHLCALDDIIAELFGLTKQEARK